MRVAGALSFRVLVDKMSRAFESTQLDLRLLLFALGLDDEALDERKYESDFDSEERNERSSDHRVLGESSSKDGRC